MLKQVLVCAALVSIAACSDLPVMPQDPSYPHFDSSDISAILQSEKIDGREREAATVLQKIQSRWWISPNEINYIQQAKVRADQRRKDERKAAQAEQDNARKVKADKEALRQYQYDFEAISSPDIAEIFIKQYAGKFDPENLTASAHERGLKVGIQRQHECIDYANKVIAQQNEIGKTVGYVNKQAIYRAGVMLVDCKSYLAKYTEEYRKFKK